MPKEHYAYPDGYPEIVINLGGDYFREDLITGKKETVPRESCVIIGQKIRSFRIIQHEHCDIISLKLKPYGLCKLGGVSPYNMLNKVTIANEILGRETKELILWLLNAESDSRRMEIINTFFENANVSRQTNRALVKIIDFICYKRGILKIEDICERFAITPRTLENHFKSYIGLSPKEFSAIVQFNNFLISSSRNEKTYTEVALDCGYYDQAHLIRKFKSFTNATPKSHLRQLNVLNGINMDILNRQIELYELKNGDYNLVNEEIS